MQGQAEAVIYSPCGTDKLALRVAHTLYVECGQGMRLLCGSHIDLEPGTVPLVTSGSVNYEYGFLQELRRGEKHLGWDLVTREYPWLESAEVVVCVSPELDGHGPQKELEAIRNFLARAQTDEAGASDRYGRALWSIE